MDDFESDPNLADRLTICHTPGCINEDLLIALKCLPTVICGGCGFLITDITTSPPSVVE